jgi:hypothetical protein
MWEVLDTAKFVAERSRLVRINQEALKDLSEQIATDTIQVPQWDAFHHYCGSQEETAFYLLVLDSINFCFWALPGKPRWEVNYGSDMLSGYFGLALALKHAAESGVPITKAAYLSQLTMDQLARIIGGDGELPLMKERLGNLRELGNVLDTEFEGEAFRLVKAARNSAVILVRLLAAKLPSFRDTARFGNHEVFLYKRGQLFAADLYGAFKGRGLGDFYDIDALTAFADYKLPQVLRHIGVFRYAPALAARVDGNIQLQPGSPEEVEIRANTIWSVELIRRELEHLGKRLRAFEIDWILWNLGQKEEFREKPYHRTVTIFY